MERLPTLFPFIPPIPVASGSGQPSQPQTPRHHHTERGGSLEPSASSPMSMVDVAPLKPRQKRGRPAYTPNTRHLKQTVKKLRSSEHSPDKRKLSAAKLELERKASELAAAKEQMAVLQAEAEGRERVLAAAKAAKEAAERKAKLEAEETRRAQSFVKRVTDSEANGGFNFKSLDHFFTALWRTGSGGDQQMSRVISKYVKDHGVAHATNMFRRSQEAKEEFISQEMAEIFEREGRAIQALLTRDGTSITELLKDFSMEYLAAEIEANAPHLWAALAMLAEPDQSTRRQADGETRRNKGLVRC
ncbi:hypothetical protein B0H16DRAFT_1351450 [Mycena metata]|uniref:Uncharacterized protein n=1 Tax=Mycena metata TaxID=1033252 RepID=A0AAD7GHA6_9AGAR|nr:hypothetical protein B0H16DRAFT_1351450 [Mycena metata]